VTLSGSVTMTNQYRLHRRRTGFFYHRVKVPADIRQLYGKEIEQRSLATRDLREAVRRLPAVIVEFDCLFCRFREDHSERLGTLDMNDAAEAVPKTPRVDIKRVAVDFANEVEAAEVSIRADAFRAAHKDLRSYLVSLDIYDSYNEYLTHLAAQGDVLPILGFVHRYRIEQRLAAIKLARAVGDFEVYESAASRLAHGISATDRAALIKAMIIAETKALESWRDEPKLVQHPKVQAVAAVVVDASTNMSAKPEPKGADLPHMSKLSRECFAALGKEKKLSAKTEISRHTQVKQFIEIAGDMPVNAYTQDDMRRLKNTLVNLPPNTRHQKAFKNMTKVQIAEKARELGLPGLSSESIRQIMTAVSIVFGWARAHYDMTLSNIVQPLIPSPSAGKDKRTKRQSLNVDDLQKLFHQPVFTCVKSADEWLRPGPVAMQHTGRFWVPLLGIFSGARLMEAVQLTRQDVGFENGIWFVDINDDDADEGKRVKNVSSLRRIPVHPELIRLGFLDFVDTIQGGDRLFPDIEIGPATQRHRSASKAFNKLLQVAGIKDKRKVWHSLRHSFEQVCRDSRVDSAIMDQLQGHSQKGMRGEYGEGYKLPELKEGIDAIRYDGLDLSHIQPFKAG
jgi:integrase